MTDYITSFSKADLDLMIEALRYYAAETMSGEAASRIAGELEALQIRQDRAKILHQGTAFKA